MDYLATGVLKGPHGIQGFIKLHSYSGGYAHLQDIGVVSLRQGTAQRECRIDQIKVSGREILIKFAGIDTPEQARTLNGWELWIPRDAAASCEAGEYYVADLMGCALLVDAEAVGVIEAIIDGPQALLLEVRSIADSKTHLVPFMKQYIGTVDITRKEMELLVPELLT